MQKMKLLAVFAMVAMLLASCTTVPGVIHDKSKPIEQGNYTVVGDEVEATEVTLYLLGFPLSDQRGSAGRRMYKRALEKAPGADALIEYTTDIKAVNLPFIGIHWYTLTGTPVKTTK